MALAYPFPVDRSQAIDRLPKVYAEALRLRDAGVEDCIICEKLSIDGEALGPLLNVAEAKLLRLMESPHTQTT